MNQATILIVAFGLSFIIEPSSTMYLLVNVDDGNIRSDDESHGFRMMGKSRQ